MVLRKVSDFDQNISSLIHLEKNAQVEEKYIEDEK